jgi:hypothetical protein
MSVTAIRPSIGAAILVVSLCLTLGGCSIFVPHVKPKPLAANDPLRVTCAASTTSELTKPAPKPGDKTQTPESLEQQRQKIGASVMRAMQAAGGVDPQLVGLNLCEGYMRAEEYRRDYYRAVRWNSGLKTTLTALMVPLAGLAAREGFDPNPSNAKIADFSVGTLVLYGWATALTSAPRQKVYLNGMQAMSCAMIEAQPIMVGVMQLQPLEAQVTRVKEARAKFEQALDDQKLKPLVNAGDDKYLKLQSDADNAIGRVADYSHQLAQASGQMLPMVETIAAQVGRNIVDTEPSIESLMTLVGGFGAQSRGLMAAALPPASPATPKAQAGNIDRVTAEANVLSFYKALRVEVEALNAMLSKVVAVANAATKLGACKAEGAANEFKVEPADAAAVIKVGEVREFKVTNKISVPTASLDGEGADSVEKLDTIVRDQTFVVRIKGLKATGESGPTLTIKDGTGQQEKRIALRIAAAETKSGGGGAAGGADGAAAADAATKAAGITEDEKTRVASAALVNEVANEKPEDFLKRSVKALQCVVKAKVDGGVGTDTRTKITEFMKDVTGRPKPDAIDAPLIAKVTAALSADAADCAKQQ